MPIHPTFPGVSVQELSNGVHTITGVPTSITAFLGRAFLGPAHTPTLIGSFADFQRNFGDLDPDYPMSYAVRDFYLNGGSQAIIVQIYKSAPPPAGGTTPSGNAPPADSASINLGNNLILDAIGPGSWGGKLRATVSAAASNAPLPPGLTNTDLFNLALQYLIDPTNPNPNNQGPQEFYYNLTVKNGPQRIDYALSTSQFVSVRTPYPTNPQVPAANTYSASGGADSQLLTTTNDFLGDQNNQTGMYALDKVDIFNLLCIPPDTRDGDLIPHGDSDHGASFFTSVMQYCNTRRALFIVDPPLSWGQNVTKFVSDVNNNTNPGFPAMINTFSSNAAVYFPRLIEADPFYKGQAGTFAPCGAIAGIMAATDASRGVWKAPAGTTAILNGVSGLQAPLSNDQNGKLNQVGINCLRTFPIFGSVVWGARTLRGADQLADEYKYVPVRRTALYIEESLYRGLQWVVFEPNDEPLWAQIRLNVTAFMQDLFRKGAFQGKTPKDAYLVKCDSETTTQTDINNGIVNILVGFAPLKPAEFVMLQIEQLAGQTQA